MIKVLLLAVLSSTIFVIATEECSLSDVGWCASYPTSYCNVTQWGTYTASYCPIHCDTPEYYLAELDCECVHGGDKVIDACGVCDGDGSSCGVLSFPHYTCSGDKDELGTAETAEACWQLCMDTGDCEQAEYWHGTGTCSKCTQTGTEHVTPFTDEHDEGYPVHVLVDTDDSYWVCYLWDQDWCGEYSHLCNVTESGTYTASLCPTQCDTPEYYLAELDCECVWGGDKVIDACGVCGGDGSSCAGCDGVSNSGLVDDACGVCDGDGSSCAGGDDDDDDAVGGDDCKGLDEAGCAAQPDSCHATNRGGKFRKCKPKRCKPMTESECEAAVHCEKKMGRRGNYKKCRRA